jgi:hypothetical protein
MNIDPNLSHLMALPVHDPNRPRLRDRVGLRGSKLEARARKYLTWHEVYAERETFRKKMQEKEPSYRARLWSLTGHLFTRQSPVKLNIPAHTNRVEEYVRRFDQANHLRSGA